MKLQGHELDKENIEYAVIPRGDGSTIVFKAKAILDYDIFDRVCPLPKPPTVIRPGGKREEDLTDKTYMQSISRHGERRMHWFVLESLSATDGLTWEKVKKEDPNTWHLYDDELKEANFTPTEIARIINAVWAVNSLDESKIEVARRNFLLGLQAEQAAISGQNTIQDSSQSGELAKD